jgi:cell division GTPase FtsZ
MEDFETGKLVLETLKAMCEILDDSTAIRIDSSDVHEILRGASSVYVATETRSGERCVESAAEAAAEKLSRLGSKEKASGMIAHFRANGDESCVSIQNAVQKLEELCSEEEAFAWGYSEDADMKGEARVTVVAAAG